MSHTLTRTSDHVAAAAADHDHLVVARLEAAELFTHYREAFEAATGLPLAIRAVHSANLPLAGAGTASAFGRLLLNDPPSLAALGVAQEQAEAEAAAGTATRECLGGLQQTLVPLVFGERTVGFLQTGWVFFRAPTEASFARAAAALATIGARFDETVLRAAYFGTRHVTRVNYEATIRLLEAFAKHLALVANQVLLAQHGTEHPTVTRARAFIAEHIAEDFSLDTVARAAGMSPYYFCKIFKANVGLNYTDYVSRARVERVKYSMLNPNTRVSEAAYAAGFQSLSQFNRVFRRIVGESPSVYRTQLHHRAQNAALN
jgi:AraC-like DNA-binding protein